MTEDNGFIIFYWWIKDDGSTRYRCRGSGEVYKKFYQEWIPKSSYRCTSDDFPWDFFVFDDPADHDRLIQDFPGDVFKDEE